MVLLPFRVLVRFSQRFWLLVPALAITLGLGSCSRSREVAPDVKLLPQAWQSYRLGDFERADDLFRQVEAQGPGDRARYFDSLMGRASIANTRQDGRDPARADALYAKILALDPHGATAPWAALDRVRVEHLKRADEPLDYAALAKAYRAVWNQFPDTPAGTEGLLVAMSLEEIGAPPDKLNALLAEYQQFLQQHPQSPEVDFIYGCMARIYSNLNQPQEELDALIASLQHRVTDKSNPNEVVLWIYWSIATTAEFDAGNFAVARQYYRKLIAEYPSDLLVFRAQEALKRMDLIEATLRRGDKIPENLRQPTALERIGR